MYYRCLIPKARNSGTDYVCMYVCMYVSNYYYYTYYYYILLYTCSDLVPIPFRCSEKYQKFSKKVSFGPVYFRNIGASRKF